MSCIVVVFGVCIRVGFHCLSQFCALGAKGRSAVVVVVGFGDSVCFFPESGSGCSSVWVALLFCCVVVCWFGRVYEL